MSGTIFIAILLVANALLVVFAYLDRVYRELGRVNSGRLRANLESFEASIEPRLNLERRRGALAFFLLSTMWLGLVAALTTWGIYVYVGSAWERSLELVVSLTAQVVVGMHLLPYLLISRNSAVWMTPVVPLVRLFLLILWPLRMAIEAAVSLAHITDSEEEVAKEGRRSDQEGIEALVEAAEEEGILEPHQAKLIEQVVEFSDKRVREVMTPRPEIVSISAEATLEELRRLLVETRFSRIPVQGRDLDDIVGVVYARDVFAIPEREAPQRKVKELARAALFVPETKLGSQLLREMQQKNQQMAIVIDEYGSVAGLVTVEDLVEEIVGEIGEEDRMPSPDVVREGDGSLVVRGSVSLEKLEELFGLDLKKEGMLVTTVAGLLNAVAGHVLAAGESVEYDGLQFQVVEANQRKVLRVRAVLKREPAMKAEAGG